MFEDNEGVFNVRLPSELVKEIKFIGGMENKSPEMVIMEGVGIKRFLFTKFFEGFTDLYLKNPETNDRIKVVIDTKVEKVDDSD